MRRVAGMSVVVRAQGVSEAWYNGQRDRVVEAVRAEAEARVQQAKAETEREREWAELETKNCNRMRREKMGALDAAQSRNRGIMDRIEGVWAYVWATATAALMTLWVWFWVLLYECKLVEYDWEGK